MIQYIQIFGERNSGTNYLHRLLEENLNNVEIGYKFGWKHTHVKLDKIEATNTENVLFICLFKNPYSWIASMHEKPHHAPQLYFKEFSEFIRSEWVCYKGKEYHLRARRLDEDPVRPEEEMMMERDPLTRQRYPNVIAMRTAKYDRFLRLNYYCENYFLLRYEDLLVDKREVIEKISRDYQIEKNKNFVPQKRYFGKNESVVFDKLGFYLNKEYMQKFNPDDIAFVNEYLDKEMEGKLGYEMVDI